MWSAVELCLDQRFVFVTGVRFLVLTLELWTTRMLFLQKYCFGNITVDLVDAV